MKILMKTKTYLVVHKPSGIPTYSDDKNERESLISKVQEFVGTQVFPVHRLDAETCGVVILALTRQRASDFMRQFKEKRISKKYLAFVVGNPPAQITCTKALKRHKSKETESAQTRIKTLERITLQVEGESKDFALVECEPFTGRFHQIRKHLKMLECPIVGDKTYGNERINKFFEDKYKIKRTLLSAGILEFLDPISKRKQTARTLPDGDFLKLLKNLEIRLKL